MAFRNLYIKEVKSILPLFGVFGLVVVVLHLFILAKSASWGKDVIFVTSLVLPLIFTAVLAIGTGYYQLNVEWRTNSIYLLLSLPIRGWKVVTAKLTAVLSLFIITLVWILASFTLILLWVKWDAWRANEEDLLSFLPALFNLLANSFWMYVLVVLFLLVVIQFSFLCGQLVDKFKWVVVLSAFFVSCWLVIRFSSLFSNLLFWTPDIFFGGIDSDAIYLHSGPFLILLLISIGFIWLNGYIFEKEVEV